MHRIFDPLPQVHLVRKDVLKASWFPILLSVFAQWSVKEFRVVFNFRLRERVLNVGERFAILVYPFILLLQEPISQLMLDPVRWAVETAGPASPYFCYTRSRWFMNRS